MWLLLKRKFKTLTAVYFSCFTSIYCILKSLTNYPNGFKFNKINRYGCWIVFIKKANILRKPTISGILSYHRYFRGLMRIWMKLVVCKQASGYSEYCLGLHSALTLPDVNAVPYLLTVPLNRLLLSTSAPSVTQEPPNKYTEAVVTKQHWGTAYS